MEQWLAQLGVRAQVVSGNKWSSVATGKKGSLEAKAPYVELKPSAPRRTICLLCFEAVGTSLGAARLSDPSYLRSQILVTGCMVTNAKLRQLWWLGSNVRIKLS
jgi:hypothetical protein